MTKYFRKNEEHFLKMALAWNGSVTPKVLLRIFGVYCYALAISYLHHLYPYFSLGIGPFELSGVALGILLVLRTNSGYERWWEARIIWGSIVNRCRNLSYNTIAYIADDEWKKTFIRWVIAYPYVCLQSLRGENNFEYLQKWFSKDELNVFYNQSHVPSYVILMMTKLIEEAKRKNLIDGFLLIQFDREKSALLDCIGASERILRTPMPLVYAIKIRRFILIFLLLLPFALLDKTEFLTPIFVALISYPLFSLDQIGMELQNPYSKENLGHLPLEDICKTIENNVLERISL